MQDIMKHHGNLVTRVHMCAYNMKIPDKHGNEYIYKPTPFFTNAPMIAARLERTCDINYIHAKLQRSRTQKAAIYTTKLIDAVTQGINDHICADRDDMHVIASIEIAKGTANVRRIKESPDKRRAVP